MQSIQAATSLTRSSFELTDLIDLSHLDYRRLPLPRGKPFRLFAIRVGARKFLAVSIVDCHHEMMVFPSLIFSKLCAFTMRDHLTPVSRVESYIQPYVSVACRMLLA